MTLPPLLLRGDALEQLRRIPDESVDAVVTDPPYGIAFMGSSWDKPAMLGQAVAAGKARGAHGLPEGAGTNSRGYADHDGVAFERWVEVWARECLRILAPGGHLVAFGGTRAWHRLASGIENAGFEIRDNLAWLYGSGLPKGGEAVTKREGWRTALKPAFEPIVLARKPLAGTVPYNLETYGVGALHTAAVQQPVTDADRAETEAKNRHADFGSGVGAARVYGDFAGTPVKNYDATKGRVPANVLLDESQAAVLDEQSGTSRSRKGRRNAPKAAGIYGAFPGNDPDRFGHDDIGGASRFMYVAKAPKSERPVVDGVAHPTVKPLAIMRWLIRLVVPEGGVLVDPFAGSGTTLEAAYLEGRESIGIELTPDYWPLIEARIARAIGA